MSEASAAEEATAKDAAAQKAVVAPGIATQTAAPHTSAKTTPLTQLASQLGDILTSVGYHEIYGVELYSWTEGTEIPTAQQIILQKFLRANAGDVSKASKQLEGALKWRKEFKPLDAVKEVFDGTRFHGLGYVTELKGVSGSSKASEVAVFNIYGAVKDNKKTFGDLDSFIRWRVALMEMTLAALRLSDAKSPLPGYGEGPDPYQAIQVHDYLSVSFLRQAPEVKAASSRIIQLFQSVYPETMSKKFFVNVPILMQWMFGAMQLFMAKETVAKMKWLSYGSELHRELGPGVPKPYGGSGPPLNESASTPKYDDPTVSSKERAGQTEEPKAASADEIAATSASPQTTKD